MISDIILTFTNQTIILPLIIIGYIWVNKKVFYKACCVFLLSMLYAADLKLIFTYIFPSTNLLFPSGHMLASTAIYGFLCYNYKNIILRFTLILLLLAIAFALVYKGYHQPFEIIGGLVFGVILLQFYLRLQNKEILILALGIMLLLLNYLLAPKILPHVWLAIFAFVGIFFGNNYLPISSKQSNSEKIFSTIIYFGLLLLVRKLFSLIHLSLIIYNMQWILVAFNLPLSVWIIKKLAINRLRSR